MADGILAGSVCVLTGASRGIGRAAALAIAKQGAKVVVNSRDAAACQAVVAQITIRVMPRPAKPSSRRSLQRAVRPPPSPAM
jgi:NAD(P)-dependent dehydrogenase (short-subunit alcohol dehydrogenase family)